MPKKIAIDAAKTVEGSRYPAPFGAPCTGRFRRCLGDAAGLSQFGANLTRLPPGGWSSQRHWHTVEDEFVFIIEGEAVLVTDSGEETLRAGDCAGFKAGVADGHHLHVARSLRRQFDRENLEFPTGRLRPGVYRPPWNNDQIARVNLALLISKPECASS